MANFSINRSALKIAFQRQKGTFKEILDENVIPALEGEKNILLKEIADHEVSADLNRKEARGENSLYGLIGFDENNQEDPVSDLIDLVDETVIMPAQSTSINVRSVDSVIGKYTIQITDNVDLDNDDRMEVPWNTSSNWVRMIEKGVNGLHYFLRGTRFATSRSGHGIQSKYIVRNEQYPARPYLSKILADFKNRLSRRAETTIKTFKYNVRNILGRFTKL